WSGVEDKPENYLQVTYEVKPVEDGTELTITQTNYDEEKAKHSAANWAAVIDEMKKIIERVLQFLDDIGQSCRHFNTSTLQHFSTSKTGDHLLILRKNLLIKGFIHFLQQIHQRANARIPEAHPPAPDVLHLAADRSLQLSQFFFCHRFKLLPRGQ